VRPQPLAGHTAVISGATSDIGRAIGLRLASAGAKLRLLGRERATLDPLAEKLRAISDDVRAFPIDLTADASLVALRGELDRVDVLIQGAGAYEMGAIERAPIADLDLQYRVNVRGPVLLTQTLLPMLRRARGQIVFLNSTLGLEVRRPAIGPYAATQHALRAIADAVRAEVNADGIRVLSVFLGRTATARQARIFAHEDRAYPASLLMQPEDVADMVTAALCLPRTAEVTEIRMRPMVKSY
jgi:NADP-dependent 3-hydroxy acid dehydrogenase YdfG